MNNIGSRSNSKSAFPRLFRADRVLLDLAQSCVKEVAAEFPERELNEKTAVIAVLIVFKRGGIAVEYADHEGNITWRATSKFLRNTGREAGALVTIGPFTASH
jgi:hypothetical protein